MELLLEQVLPDRTARYRDRLAIRASRMSGADVGGTVELMWSGGEPSSAIKRFLASQGFSPAEQQPFFAALLKRYNALANSMTGSLGPVFHTAAACGPMSSHCWPMMLRAPESRRLTRCGCRGHATSLSAMSTSSPPVANQWPTLGAARIGS
jgi:hypothetical protein